MTSVGSAGMGAAVSAEVGADGGQAAAAAEPLVGRAERGGDLADDVDLLVADEPPAAAGSQHA